MVDGKVVESIRGKGVKGAIKWVLVILTVLRGGLLTGDCGFGLFGRGIELR